MKTWTAYTHFAALDWADDHHDVVVVDAHGQIVLALTFPHTAAGWQQLEHALAPWPGLPVAVETNCGPAVDQLLQRACIVYPVMPKAAARYRERQRPSGSKDDRHDAWSLADALRLDGQHWRPLSPLDALTAELRLVSRDEVALIEERTALVNRLQAALKEYYPAAVEAFADWTQPHAWAFVVAFPTPAALQAAGPRAWKKFLHVHRLWRTETAPARLALFAHATALAGSPAVTAAKSLLAVSLARLLQTLQAQLQAYRQRIAALFAAHPDHELFGSLPGAGPKLAPRLLAELAGSNWEDVPAVQCRAGTAPVTYQSGQIKRVQVRRACIHWLRAALHLWTDESRHKSAWAATYYQAHRDKGQSHACALRCLGQRWLEIIGGMCRSRTPYDAEKHLRELQAHGSWVLQLLPPATTSATPTPAA